MADILRPCPFCGSNGPHFSSCPELEPMGTNDSDLDETVNKALETTGLRRNRITIIVEVDTDPIPGWGHDPEDYVKHIERLLNDSIPHYKPVVRLGRPGGIIGTSDSSIST